MKSKRIIVAIGICLLSCGSVWADDVKKPDLQIADNTFFDPTKKQAQEEYHFGVEYRIEAGYAQHEQRTRDMTYPQLFLHGARVGATFTFLLPLHFSIQTGLLYTVTCGKNEQHWRSMSIQATREEMMQHKVLEHNLTIPVRMYYTIPLWKKLNLFFYTGLQVQVGLAETDYIDASSMTDGTVNWLISQNIPVATYDRMKEDRYRTNAQWGLGGGFEWDRYRLQSGYDFGLNNMARKLEYAPKRNMTEWGWFVSFSYRF